MTTKQIITRQQFETLQVEAGKRMATDTELIADARALLSRADDHRWIHGTTWMGEPLLNLPQDVMALQAMIWRTRPEYIVEIGVAWGGSTLFLASMLDLMGGKKVVGVDIFIPPDLRARLGQHERFAKRMELIEGSSLATETFDRVKDIVRGGKTMVILDSNHTHDHVLQELELYGPLVGKGQYLLCCDTIVEYADAPATRTREWCKGNSPATAAKAYTARHPRFQVDQELENRLLLTCHPGGYLLANADPS
ncbi:MAG: class I SAM-dependent methyltransferase [Phycisphaerae bacterium]|nr:class I SAM-dependent methyltransferase [Phycisphaerae bacterium]